MGQLPGVRSIVVIYRYTGLPSGGSNSRHPRHASHSCQCWVHLHHRKHCWVHHRSHWVKRTDCAHAWSRHTRNTARHPTSIFHTLQECTRLSAIVNYRSIGYGVDCMVDNLVRAHVDLVTQPTVTVEHLWRRYVESADQGPGHWLSDLSLSDQLLLWVLWSWLLRLLVLICRPWAPTVFGLVTHLETSLTTTLVALAAVMSVAVVTLRVKPLIPSLSMTTRGLLTRTLVVVSLLLLSLRLNCC